jgi:hypothetical protein
MLAPSGIIRSKQHLSIFPTETIVHRNSHHHQVVCLVSNAPGNHTQAAHIRRGTSRYMAARYKLKQQNPEQQGQLAIIIKPQTKQPTYIVDAAII